jgi:centromere/kinetochore protein ZW10
MENAVRFERDPSRLHVQYRLSHDGINGIELQTVLEALDVSFIHVPMYHTCML